MSEYIYATNGELVANIDGEISLARKEVVRCRDCARKDYCCFIYEYDYDPNGFCAWGKRKEAENGI